MAKTAYSIAMDFNRAKAQANKLESLANNIARQRSKANQEKQTIAANWKSDSANAYLRKIEVVESDMANAEKKLRQTANTIVTVATNTYRAERQALELAQKRNK